MKIAIVLGPFQPLPPTGFGAVEKVWMELARGFARAGHTVCVIGRGPGGARDSDRPSTMRVLEVPGLDATGHIGADLIKDLAYALRIVTAIPKSDIVVTNSFWLPVVLSPLKRLKGRIVVHVARFPKRQMWLYRFVDRIQTVSVAVANAIRKQTPGVAGRVSVVGYPVDTALYRPPADGRRMSASPIVLYVGRVHPEKGVHLLIDAFRRLLDRIPSARLRIVGPVAERQGGGGEGYRRALEAAAAGLQVEFAGAISDGAELSAEYRNADCFCYPSLADKGEAFGRAVLEAMAAGLPCVVSGLECFSDFLVDRRDGVVFDHRAGDAALALSGALAAVLADPALASSLGKNARLAAERFSEERITEDYLALFSEVLGREAGRHA